MNMSDNPETLQQAILYFADPDRCEEYMRKIRWQDSVPVCPNCGAKVSKSRYQRSR